MTQEETNHPTLEGAWPAGQQDPVKKPLNTVLSQKVKSSPGAGRVRHGQELTNSPCGICSKTIWQKTSCLHPVKERQFFK